MGLPSVHEVIEDAVRRRAFVRLWPEFTAGELQCPLCHGSLQMMPAHISANSDARDVRVAARCVPATGCGMAPIDVALRIRDGVLAVALDLAPEDGGNVLLQEAAYLRQWADDEDAAAGALPADDPRAIEAREREARYRRQAADLDETAARVAKLTRDRHHE